NRPIGELVKSLQSLGAEIEYLEKEGFPPLKIRGRKLKGGPLKIDSGISSQYISAILMIAPLFDEGLQLELTGDTISSSYIDMTIALMKESGAEVSKQGNQIRVSPKPYEQGTIEVEPDWSSASYWFMIAGLHPESNILLKGLKNQSYQGDAQITAMFDNLGISSEFNQNGLILRHSEIKMTTFRYDFRENPDMVQSFIPYCIARDIPFYFSGCRTLRIKETDRVSALHAELFKFGVQISFSEDGDMIWWDGKSKPDWNRDVTIETYKDHRMALGFAPLVIKARNMNIKDPGVVSKSYPNFWEDLRKAGFSLE
ncbi:MAG: 3-phosphoshikimate 1-carboxyvinyltransferase, partial [Bacteroidales bacterium]